MSVSYTHLIVEMQKFLDSKTQQDVTRDMLLSAKQIGFSDKQIATFVKSTELAIRKCREEYGKREFEYCESR